MLHVATAAGQSDSESARPPNPGNSADAPRGGAMPSVSFEEDFQGLKGLLH